VNAFDRLSQKTSTTLGGRQIGIRRIDGARAWWVEPAGRNDLVRKPSTDVEVDRPGRPTRTATRRRPMAGGAVVSLLGRRIRSCRRVRPDLWSDNRDRRTEGSSLRSRLERQGLRDLRPPPYAPVRETASSWELLRPSSTMVRRRLLGQKGTNVSRLMRQCPAQCRSRSNVVEVMPGR